ncbi:MAG: multiple sugar transport system substrate-binding protein [Candidatus Atribacteria bacterium]|nr:multiple sugar transport system substrate-binding protein [Candidatus Atribacteria bacterium]MDI3531164.1 multiple sugar transport system substrate-binding protein [Candidatus Atribacteria bacterium]
MRRKVLFIGVFAVVFLMMVPAFAQEVVKYWMWLDDPTDRTVWEMVEEFNAANPEIKVEIENIPLKDYHDKLVTALSAGAGPDVARFKDWWLGEFHEAGLLEPLSEYIANWPGKDDVIPNLWNTGKIPGEEEIYMMPHQFITFYLYYRKDWFQEAGLKPPVTFDDFLKAAQTLTDPEANRYGFGLRGGSGGQDQWLAFMVAGGARVVDEAGNIVINSEKAVAVNQWYIDLYRKYKVAPPSAPTDDYARITGAFKAGITAMIAHHVGSSVIMTEALGDKVGVTHIPVADPANPATMATMSGNVIFATSKVKDAAFKFLSWITETEQMDRWSRSRNGQLPVLKSVAAMDYYNQNEFFRISLEAADFAITWPPLPGVGYVAASVWQVNMQRALLGEISSKEMLDAIAEALKER